VHWPAGRGPWIEWCDESALFFGTTKKVREDHAITNRANMQRLFGGAAPAPRSPGGYRAPSSFSPVIRAEEEPDNWDDDDGFDLAGESADAWDAEPAPAPEPEPEAKPVSTVRIGYRPQAAAVERSVPAAGTTTVTDFLSGESGLEIRATLPAAVPVAENTFTMSPDRQGQASPSKRFENMAVEEIQPAPATEETAEVEHPPQAKAGEAKPAEAVAEPEVAEPEEAAPTEATDEEVQSLAGLDPEERGTEATLLAAAARLAPGAGPLLLMRVALERGLCAPAADPKQAVKAVRAATAAAVPQLLAANGDRPLLEPLLELLERWFRAAASAVAPAIRFVLHSLYDEEVVEEEVFIRWWDGRKNATVRTPTPSPTRSV
jgi:hypothetical protein